MLRRRLFAPGFVGGGSFLRAVERKDTGQMMSLKKKGLVASVAAMAVAIGGLGIGAGVANAAGSTITLKNATQGHTYTAFQLGNYATSTISGTAPHADAIAVTGANDSAKALIRQAAAKAVPNPLVIPGATDPVTWAADLPTGSAQLRMLTAAAQKLIEAPGAAGTQSPITGTDDGTGSGTPVPYKITSAAQKAVTANGDTDITVDTEGWYLIVDQWKRTNAMTGTQEDVLGIGALVGTFATKEGQQFTELGSMKLGEVDVKPQDDGSGNPGAEPKKTFTGSISEGANPRFYLSVNGPVFSESVTPYASYSYKLVDTPQDLEIESLGDIQVYIAPKGTSDVDAVKPANQKTINTDYVITKTVEDPASSGHFTDKTIESADMPINSEFNIDMSKYFEPLAKGAYDEANNGQKIVVTYKAKVTGAEPKNQFDIDDNGVRSPGDKTDEKENGIGFASFTKVGLGGELNGAKFKVTDQYGNVVLTDVTSAKVKGTDDVEREGVVLFKDLGEGEYTIEETYAPQESDGADANYIITPHLEFKMKVVAGDDLDEVTDGTVTFTETGNTGTWNSDDAVNGVEDVSVNDKGTAGKLQNVKNLAQLPLTGAHGIIVFTLLALVLGGGALTMVAISKRNKKRGLSL